MAKKQEDPKKSVRSTGYKVPVKGTFVPATDSSRKAFMDKYKKMIDPGFSISSPNGKKNIDPGFNKNVPGNKNKNIDPGFSIKKKGNEWAGVACVVVPQIYFVYYFGFIAYFLNLIYFEKSKIIENIPFKTLIQELFFMPFRHRLGL